MKIHLVVCLVLVVLFCGCNTKSNPASTPPKAEAAQPDVNQTADRGLGSTSSLLAHNPTSTVEGPLAKTDRKPAKLEQAAARDVGYGEYEGVPPPQAHLPPPDVEDFANLPEGLLVSIDNNCGGDMANLNDPYHDSVWARVFVSNSINRPTAKGAMFKVVPDKGLKINSVSVTGALYVLEASSSINPDRLTGSGLRVPGLLPGEGFTASMTVSRTDQAKPSSTEKLYLSLYVKGPDDKKWHIYGSTAWWYWPDPNK